jgi:type VI secretion system protein ImpK
MSTVLEVAPSLPDQLTSRRGELAAAFQEAFTVAVRLRTNRQVATDANSFRAQIKHLLATADRDAREAGYSAESVRLAVYAFIAFLDESVLNAVQPIFATWSRQPLQEEIFGDHIAGETFFAHLGQLLERQDSDELADLLEIYLLCLLLGFRGRYGTGDPGGVQARMRAVQEKIRRCRGAWSDLSPAWTPPRDTIESPHDRWVRRLALAAIGSFALAAILWLGLKLTLNLGLTRIHDLVAQLVR